MRLRRDNPAWALISIGVAVLFAPGIRGQAAPQGVLVDQVIAVVNGDLILESDVDEEQRFEAFDPIREAGGPTPRAAIVERLIDRALILQQAKLQPGDEVTPGEAEAQLAKLRQEIPACKEFHCETDAGWKKFVESQGFTVAQVEEMLRQRMQILKFIEIRFRSGIRISPDEIKAYYDKTLVPELAKRNTPPPPLDSVSERIQEILLQERVSGLLQDWLSSLKAEGTVRIIKPGEVAP